MDIKEKIKDLMVRALENIDIKVNKENITIEVPKDKKFGDFSSNIALQLSKELKKNPKEIAESIIKGINNDDIEKIEVAGAGFINFYVSSNYLFDNLKEILIKRETYGKNDIGAGKKINVEYVSANPTGILHLGTARGASYGDNLCNILEFSGFDVTREYYINDAGNQIRNLGLSLKARYMELLNIESEFPEDGYHGKEIITLAQELIMQYNDKALSQPNDFFEKIAVDFLLDRIKKDLESFGVTFDVWTSEKSIYSKGKVEQSLEKLKKLNKTYEQDGAIWLKTTDYGDEKDRVLIKNDGSFTYLMPDIAYHLDKFDRGYDYLVDVFGADHHGYIDRLKAAINALGYDGNKVDIKILQMVKLLRNKELVKMSKRTGQTVTISELVEEVGINAARYFFAMRSLDTQMEFDIDLATKNSNENPVFYVNYAYSRICSILNNKKLNEIPKNYDIIDRNNAYNILKKLYEFKGVIENAALRKEPHLVTN
jgi:arginyl-tRNA synthetase